MGSAVRLSHCRAAWSERIKTRFPQKVLPEFAHEGYDSQEFFPRDVIITLVLVVQVARVKNGAFLPVLNLRKYGSDGVI